MGRSIKYVDVPEDTARRQMIDAKMPEWLVNALSELNAVGKAAYVAEVSPTVEEVMGRKPLTFRQFAEENKTAFQ